MKKYTVVRDYAKLYHKQAGMTLIELAVVLLILVGLAGLLIPYVSGFVSKTHDSTTVSTVAELNNTIQRYQTTKLGLPKNLETLYDTTSQGVYTKMQRTDFLALVGTSDLSFANASLAKAGVTTALNNNNATDDATFKSTTGTAVTLGTDPIGATGPTPVPLVQLTGNTTTQSDQTFFGQISANLLAATTLDTTPTNTDVKNQLMYAFGGTRDSWDTNCTNYVVMGIGSANSLIPSAMQAAPVHFGGSAGEAPATVYDRFVAVFAVPSSGAVGATTTTPNAANVTCPKPDAAARFIGSAGIMDFPALVGLNGAQQWANANLTKDN